MSTGVVSTSPLSSDFISRLPVEILREIFMIVRDREIAGVCAGQWNISAPERLAAVSSTWRYIVFQMPLLWNTMQFNEHQDPSMLNIELGGHHLRHLELSGDMQVDIIIGAWRTLTPVSYPFCLFPMDRVRRIVIRHHSSIGRPSLVDETSGTIGLFVNLRTSFAAIKVLDIYILGANMTVDGNLPQVAQLTVVEEEGVDFDPIRVIIKEIRICMVIDVELLLSNLRQLHWGNVTHYSITNICLTHIFQFTRAFADLGSSLTDLELGPLTWQRIPWVQMLGKLSRLQTLRLYQDCRTRVQEYVGNRIYPEGPFQTLLDALPRVEAQLARLSRMYLTTSTRYSGKSMIQFIQKFNLKGNRGMLELAITRRTFTEAELAVLGSWTSMTIID